MTRAKAREEVIPGTLQMLILKALSVEPMHGWGITERLQLWSREILRVSQGTLYPSLYLLEQQGMISSTWRVTDNNRRARYYALTALGRRHLAEERRSWERMSRAVDLVLAVP